MPLGGRSQEITYQATVVKESCRKIVADLRGLPDSPCSGQRV